MSSTVTVGANIVALFSSTIAICFAVPLIAGPAGLLPLAGASPGIIEMRVVFGVQVLAPRHVSRTNTCRIPLFGALGAFAIAAAGVFAAALAVTATKATNRPELLIDGRMLSVPFKAPLESVEIKVVEGLHEFSAAMQVSRKYTWRPAGAPSTRFVAEELNATYLPSGVTTA